MLGDCIVVHIQPITWLSFWMLPVVEKLNSIQKLLDKLLCLGSWNCFFLKEDCLGLFVLHSLFAELTLTMYFSVSPQAYLDSLEGNTYTNTILETVPYGSVTFTVSINKKNLAFWRNILIVSTNKCLWLRNQ